MTPFDFWAPFFRAPLSGDVTQDISPSLISFDIKGVPAIERRVQTEVASYGKQLGKVLEALQDLSEATKTPLPEIDDLVTQIEAVKETQTLTLRDDAEKALARLQKADPEAWAEVLTSAKAPAI